MGRRIYCQTNMQTSDTLKTRTDREATDSRIVLAVDALIEKAITAGATDIHIEPRENFVVVRYRIDGLLRVANKLPYAVLAPLIKRIKSLARLKIDEQRAPQDGHYSITLDGNTYALHVFTLPIMDGEKAVLRIINESSKAATLEELGLWGESLQTLQQAIVQPHGLVLVSGPMGSGTSTTLFSILSLLHTPNTTIATIEDPIKYRIPGATQTQIHPVTGLTFARGLQALLARNPNIIMIGDMQDSDTAELAAQAAGGGHLVCAALRTENAASCLVRLLHMDLKPSIVSSSVHAVVGQRLVRQLCVDCRKSVKIDQAMLQKLTVLFGLDEAAQSKRIHELEKAAVVAGIGTTSTSDRAYSSNEAGITYIWQADVEGCESCNHSGYKGRIGIFEVLSVSDTIQTQLVAHLTAEALQATAVGEGMITMQLDGLIKTLCGKTTIDEVLRVTATAKLHP